MPRLPRSENDYESLFRVRKTDVKRIIQISKPDIFMSHDWPVGVYNYGDKETLLRKKKFFRSSVENNTLGRPPNAKLLNVLKT